MIAPLIVAGQLRCPKKKGATMARDACVKEQARCGLGCGISCPIGVGALRAAADFLEHDARSEAVREVVRKQHEEYERKPGARKRWADYKPTGRPRGRPRKPREPVPGGNGPRAAAGR
jgi:hypothetical protein